MTGGTHDPPRPRGDPPLAAVPRCVRVEAVSHPKTERNARILRDRPHTTLDALAEREGISIERVRQIYERERRKTEEQHG
jgi:hypothetical protein